MDVVCPLDVVCQLGVVCPLGGQWTDIGQTAVDVGGGLVLWLWLLWVLAIFAFNLVVLAILGRKW